MNDVGRFWIYVAITVVGLLLACLLVMLLHADRRLFFRWDHRGDRVRLPYQRLVSHRAGQGQLQLSGPVCHRAGNRGGGPNLPPRSGGNGEGVT